MLQSKNFNVVPEKIIFKDVKPGSSLCYEFYVHNTGKKPSRIRFLMPNNANFSFIGNTSVLTAPGLEIKGVIRYFATKNECPTVLLKIESSEGSVNLPISAVSPSASIQFEKSKIDLGITSPNLSVSKALKVGNYGDKECNVCFNCTDSCAQIEPKEAKILPNQEVELNITYKPIMQGDHNFKIEARNKDDRNKEVVASIDVHSKVVENEVVLVFEDKEVKELNFDKIYYGQRRIMQVTVKNKCAATRSFEIVPPFDPRRSIGVSRAPSTVNDPEIVFTAVPCEGILKPYSSTTVSFIFGTSKLQKTDETLQMFNHLSTLSIRETKQSFDFQLIGVAIAPEIQFNMVDFDFGHQKINTKKTQILKIDNKSNSLPISFEIKEIAHFRFMPISGTIKPNSSKEIKITFFPKNMGDFEVTTHIDISKGVLKRNINLKGVAVMKNIENKKFVRKPIYETDKTAKYNIAHPTNPDCLTFQEIKRKEELRSEFDGYISSSALKREKMLKEKEKRNKLKENINSLKNLANDSNNFYIQEYVSKRLKEIGSFEENDARDLGIEHCAGLTPPDPQLIRGRNHFVIPDPRKLGLIHVSTNKDEPFMNKGNHSDKLMIQKKFKPLPTTAPETEECNRSLTPVQLTKIIATHQTINFGTVSVYSQERRSFEITNNLDQHIIVSLNINSDELSRSTPPSQVIPPQQTAGFDITFLSKKPQNFLNKILYSINNHHQFAVNVVAEVVSIDVKLSRSQIDFRFPDDIIDTSITEPITLTNTSNATVNYKWSNFNGGFSINSENGLIPPNSSVTLDIRYTPGRESHSETVAILNIIGGSQKHLKLIGDMGKPALMLEKKQISFGVIPIDITKEMNIRLRNVSQVPAIFNIINPTDDTLYISPNTGKINAEEFLDLQLTIEFHEPTSFQTTITIEICGSEPITFQVFASAEIPSVEFKCTNLNFGQKFVGTSTKKIITACNTGNLTAVIYLDLTNYPFFHLEYPATIGISETEEEKNSILLLSNSSDFTLSRTETEISASSTATEVSLEKSVSEIGFTYKITILPHNSLDLTLVFQPKKVGKYKFNLPMTLLHNVKELNKTFGVRKSVKAEAIHAPILPSDTIVDFGIATIIDKDNPSACAISRQIFLKNESKSAIGFRFDIQNDSDDNIFHISLERGKIDYCGTKSIIFEFSPKDTTPYNRFLPLYSIDETTKEECLITNIHLLGIGSSRRFKTSTNQICMPPVPLGVKVERTVMIVNTSYCVTSLKATLPINEKSIPLSLSFPKGNQFTYTTQSIPLVVSFLSNRPLSFSTTVAITDDEGSSFSFNVSASTDNSIFTLYSYFSNQFPDISSKSSNIIDEEQMKNNFFSIFLSTNDLLSLDLKCPESNFLMTSFLTRFLNTFALNESSIKSFPEDFVKNGPTLVSEMISNLSDRKIAPQFLALSSIPGLANRNNHLPSSNVLNPKVSRYTKMKNMIHFLMSKGAILSYIRPEFLLSKTEFSDVMRVNIIKGLLGIDYYGAPDITSLDKTVLNNFTSSRSFSAALLPRLKIAERLYPYICAESWTAVILQILKLYMLGKINSEGLNSTVGVPEALKKLSDIAQPEIYQQLTKKNRANSLSNIYSPVELLLLKWVSIHYCLMNPKKMKVFNNFDDLRNPLVFLSIFQSHLPELIPNIKQNPQSIEDHENNMKILSESINSIKLSFIPTTGEILNGNCIMMSLIIGILYQTIPYFIPTTTLTFENIPLCQSKIQMVTITNPSKYEIVFHATIDGSKNFGLVRNNIKLGPNESAEFEVEYTARQHKTEKARLILAPDKPKMYENSSQEPNTTRKPTSNLGKIQSPVVKKPNSARISSKVEAPAFATTIVVNLEATTRIRGPFKSINIEAPLYEPFKSSISISNAIKTQGTFKVLSRYFQISDENGNLLNKNVNISSIKQVNDFLKDPVAEPSFLTPKTKFESYIQKHQTFLFSNKTIMFPQENSSIDLDYEFIPISLGIYRCLILFYNQELGQFMYEIIAKATYPHDTETNVKLKIESGQKTTSNINFDISNKQLFYAMSYSICKGLCQDTTINEAKFFEMMNFHTRELHTEYTKSFISIKYNVSCTADPFFTSKSLFETNKTHAQLPVTFAPTKPGDYKCHVIIVSDYDVRVFLISGTALMATKTLLIEMNTYCGKTVTQMLPFTNPSNIQWHFKTRIKGDNRFHVPERFDIPPHGSFELPLTFCSKDKGMFNSLLTVRNYTKEITVNYNIMAMVDESPAEDKIQIKCLAKEKLHYSFQVEPFLENGTAEVSSTVPIITFDNHLTFKADQPPPLFEFDVYSLRSGLSSGIIKFYDKHTFRSIWYILEVNVESPNPEEIIRVSTRSRQSITVKIPVNNPSNDHDVEFEVIYHENDFFGDKVVSVKPNETFIYELVFSPLNPMKRTSYISFINDTKGEFVYELDITVDPPALSIVAPFSTPIGKFSTTNIIIENPLDKAVVFKVENQNPKNFQIKCEPVLVLNQNEKKQLEVRYIPSSIGNVDTSILSFKSNEAGEWFYKLSGVGKPPQPMSPVILESELNRSASASIIFKNPFPFMTKFEATISTSSKGIFSFLNKKGIFTMANYGDEHHIAIQFAPKEEFCYQADVIIRCLDQSKNITWNFPVIGNGIKEKSKPLEIRGKANTVIETAFDLILAAENENYKFNEYALTVDYPTGYDWMSKILEIRTVELKKKNNSPCLVVFSKFAPKRPIEEKIKLIVENPFGQRWEFNIFINIRAGEIHSKIYVESDIKNASHSRINVSTSFPSVTPFHAYFAAGSAAEFSVSPENGYIEPSIDETVELPFDVIFTPVIYGKVFKGLLVVDTLEEELIFEVFGKIPEYIPPVIKNSVIDTTRPLSARRNTNSRTGTKKRNIIRENIENVKVPKTNSDVRVKIIPRRS